MNYKIKTNDGQSFEGENFQDILTELEKFRTIFDSNKKSTGRLVNLIAKIQTSGSFSSEEWHDIIDDMQVLKGFEDSVRKLNDLFLIRLDDLSKLKRN